MEDRYGAVRDPAVPSDSFFLQHVSYNSQYVTDSGTSSASHSPGWQLLFVDSSQGFGSTLDHLALCHARHGLMPFCSVDVGQAALQDLTHCNNETRPAQAVVWRGEGLSLHRGTVQKHFAELLEVCE